MRTKETLKSKFGQEGKEKLGKDGQAFLPNQQGGQTTCAAFIIFLNVGIAF